MANPEQLEILKQGVEVWNKWRSRDRAYSIDLSEVNLTDIVSKEESFEGINLKGANLSGIKIKRLSFVGSDLSGADFTKADLSGADLSRADVSWGKFSKASLEWTNLMSTNLSHSVFEKANLHGANLQKANLHGAAFTDANLAEATLTGALLAFTNFLRATFTKSKLTKVNFFNTNLNKADFTESILGGTSFSNTDMSGMEGLHSAAHIGPSTIGIDTLFLSKGEIPDSFLRECGVPEDFITYLPSLIGCKESIVYNSCFISYSTPDEEFAKRLHSRMRDAKLRVWFAPEDMKGGIEIFSQIDTAIQVHDKLLLVLSKSSMKSNWVAREIKRAFKTEEREKRRKLFPIRLVDFETLQNWELNDGDTGKDLAAEIRKFFIPDFSHWKNHDAFEISFEKLLRDLKAEQ